MTQPPPHETVWTLTNAAIAAKCLHVVADLGVADDVEEEPLSAQELALRCGVDADALGRVLRLLAAHGVFEREDGGFRHSPASELLRSAHPLSMRAFPRMMGLPIFAATFANLEHSIRTGSPSIETIEPRGLWPYLQDHPDEALVFDQAMTAKAAADIGAVLAAYDFSGFTQIADIGGGRGHLLCAVLDAVPNAHGVLFDLPAVIGSSNLEHQRLRPQAGDFFVDRLPTADAYVLMEVLHDWSDMHCVEILRAIRRAATPDATLLVIENVLPEAETDPRGHTLDVIMLAVTGGRERTASQLNGLFDRAGFRAATVIGTAGPLRIVETNPV